MITTTGPGKRGRDGSAGDVDYAEIGHSYARFRQPDPLIAQQIWAALGDARSVLNVGAGAGSYEPTHREVTAVEPSAAMRAQRPAHLSPAIDAVAEALPFADLAFDASMASITVHQWQDVEQGLREMRRVTRGPVVVFAADPDAMQDYWLNDYCPEVCAIEVRRFPSLARIAAGLGGRVSVQPVPIPLHCTDGFNEAYYGRPEALLNPEARLACSSWSLVPATVVARFTEHLARDLASGAWDQRFGHLRSQAVWHGPLRLLVAWTLS
jgi:hypothetical protein